MIVDVYAAGPSLRATPVLPGAELRIGVNRAVEVKECDLWVFRDPCSEQWCPVGDPEWFIPKSKYLRKMIQTEHPRMFWEDAGLSGEDSRWVRFSTFVALWRAADLGAGLIRLYGADMRGESDCMDGDPRLKSDRDEYRWQLERETYLWALGELQGKGVDIARIL